MTYATSGKDYLFLPVLKVRTKSCQLGNVFMGVASVGILPKQRTGGSVPQKLSTFGGLSVNILTTLIW